VLQQPSGLLILAAEGRRELPPRNRLLPTALAEGWLAAELVERLRNAAVF